MRVELRGSCARPGNTDPTPNAVFYLQERELSK